VTDGQQFHQYQQSEKLHTRTQKTKTHGVGREDPNLGHAQKGGKVKPIPGISFLSDIWISNDNAKPLTCRKLLTNFIT